MQWSDLNVMITGGTGSFGKKFTEIMLRETQDWLMLMRFAEVKAPA